MFIRDVSGLSLGEALEKFINLKSAMNRSEETITFYKERGNWFLDFLKYEKGIFLTNEIIDDHITDYILYRKEQKPNISSHTINNNLSAIRAILYYFMEKGYTEPFHIPLISVKSIPKDGYTTAEQELLLKKPNTKTCSFAEYRNWVMICHLLASGIRSKTLRYIRNYDVKLSERIIRLTEVKNKEGYEMPISAEYFPILSEYMKIRGGEPEDFLFCNQFGKQFTAESLKSVFIRYNKNRGVEKTGLHIFRNTFAKHWLLEGGTKEKLQHALGHKNSHMVDEYARLYGRELREEFGKFTPLAKMKDTVLEKKTIKMKKAKS